MVRLVNHKEDEFALEKKIKVGVVQFDVKLGQIDTNLAQVFTQLDILASSKVCLAVLPEMFSCSFDNENLARHSENTDQIIRQLCQFAKDRNMAIAGSVPQKENNNVYNSFVFIDVDGKLKAQYHKIHLFRLTGEDLYFAPGHQVGMVDSSFGRLGLLTCYDLRFPELARAMFLKGAQMILVAAQWPDSRAHNWQTLIQARAVENQLFVVAANRTGVEADLYFSGHSMIVDPFGKVLVDAAEDQSCAVVQIDIEKVARAREQIPCMADRRPESYE